MIRRINLLLVLPLFAATAYAQTEPRLTLPPAKTSDKESAFGLPIAFAGAGVPIGADPHRYLISKEMMIRWSEANDAAWGFSKSLGRWAKQEINPPADQSPWISEPVTLFVSDNVAVWRVGSSYYAYSGQTGRWDVLRLPEGHAPKPLLDDNLVFVNDTDNDYAFAASTGRWSSPKDSGEATESNPDGTQIKIFTLRHAKANEAQVLINQLFVRDIHSAVADERSNSLIVRGPAEQLNIIFAILTKLDEDWGGNQATRADGPRSGLPKGGGTSGTIVEPSSSAEGVEELAKKYNDKEQQALALAWQIRELNASGNADLSRVSVLTAELRRAVGQAFAARQQLHQAEAWQLQQRIAGIQRNVATRDRLSDKIIELRVNDLLNPELQWNEYRSNVPGWTGRSSTSPKKAHINSAPAKAGVASESKATSALLAMPVNWQHGLAVSIIWDQLRVTVQAVTPTSVSKYGYNGGLLVDAGPALEPMELRTGDVILGVHDWETNSIYDLAWTLLQPVSKGVSVMTPEARSTSETAAVRILRDGKVETKTVTLPPWSPEPNRAGQPTRRNTFSAPARSTTAAPGLNLPLDAQATTIRSAEEFHRRIDSARSKVESIKEEPLSGYVGKDAAEQSATKQWNLDLAERELAFLRDEHGAQLRLLELEVQDASSAVEAAGQQLKQTQQEFAVRPGTRGNLLGQERAVQEADLRLQRAKILLDLYRKADPKNAAPQAAADPASTSAPSAAPRR